MFFRIDSNLYTPFLFQESVFQERRLRSSDWPLPEERIFLGVRRRHFLRRLPAPGEKISLSFVLISFSFYERVSVSVSDRAPGAWLFLMFNSLV